MERRRKNGTFYNAGLSQRRVDPLCTRVHRSWKQIRLGGFFLVLIKTAVVRKNSAGILKPPSCFQKDFSSSLKTSNRLCLLPPLTHKYQTIKATSGLYRKFFLLGGGTKHQTFLSGRNKNSLNKVSKAAVIRASQN